MYEGLSRGERGVGMRDNKKNDVMRVNFPSSRGRKVPSVPWGSIDAEALGYALLSCQNDPNYGKSFYVKLIREDLVNPFRAFFESMGRWYRATIVYRTYPTSDRPDVRFEDVPPCPEHQNRPHPNINGTGSLFIPGKTNRGVTLAERMMDVVYVLRNPDHANAVSPCVESQERQRKINHVPEIPDKCPKCGVNIKASTEDEKIAIAKGKCPYCLKKIAVAWRAM